MVRKVAFMAVGFALLLSAAGVGADTWRIQPAPWIEMPELIDETGPEHGGPYIGTSQPFGSALMGDDPRGAWFASGSARKDRWVIFADETQPALIHGDPPVPIGQVDGDVSQRSLTAGLGYEMVRDATYGMDLLVGARQWQIRTGTAMSLSDMRARDSGQWLDPIVGFRLRAGWSPRWSTTVYGDVAGFGGGAEHAWQLVGSVNYRLTDVLLLSGGYRHMAVDHDGRDVLSDFEISGPLLGVTVRF